MMQKASYAIATPNQHSKIRKRTVRQWSQGKNLLATNQLYTKILPNDESFRL